jgi:hypothetical protein
MAIEAARLAYPFPYLHDATQEVALAYGATCTPDFFVYDDKLTCATAASSTGRAPAPASRSPAPTCGPRSMRCCGASPREMQTASCGCNIKWRAREPN